MYLEHALSGVCARKRDVYSLLESSMKKDTFNFGAMKCQRNAPSLDGGV